MFQKIWYRKFLCIRGEGASRYCRKFFVSQGRNEKFCKETFVCIRNFLVRKKLWRRKGYHDFPSKFFCPTVPKNFVREQFCVSKKFWYRRFSCIGGGHHGLVENFLFHSAKKIRRGTLLCIRNFLEWKKNYGHARCITISSNFYFSQYPNSSKGKTSWFQKNSGL